MPNIKKEAKEYVKNVIKYLIKTGYTLMYNIWLNGYIRKIHFEFLVYTFKFALILNVIAIVGYG
jgi:hypothetical protein